MGARGGGPWPRAKKIILILCVAFAILTVSIVALVLVAEGAYTAKDFMPHTPIYINGNARFGFDEGVTAGTGTEADPFVIEGWEILGVRDSGISIDNTDAHIVIRNVSVSGTWSPWEKLSDSVGISLDNASNIKIESSFISGVRSGVRANGTFDVTEGLEISRCTFASTGQNLIISGTSDCLVTHSYFDGYYESLMHISNCTSVECSFNKINGGSYGYMTSRTTVVLIENVTELMLDENDIRSYSDSGSVRLVDTRSAVITNNSVKSYGQDGILAERPTDVLIYRNEISSGNGIGVRGGTNTVVEGNYLHSESHRWGSLSIHVSDSLNATVSGNVIIRGGGIAIANSRESIVHDNYVSDAGYFTGYGYLEHATCMLTYGCQNLTIARNILLNASGPGLELSGTNVTIDGNLISSNSRMGDYYASNGAGLKATGSGLSIRNNRIYSNTQSLRVNPGISLQSCRDSVFEGNNISDDMEIYDCDNLTVRSNTYDGKWNLSVISWTHITTFEKNNFAEGIDVNGNSSVIHWDAGYPEGGNYWPAYVGVDIMNGPNQDIPGPDGFGDTAYQISSGSLDRYPCMHPVKGQDIQPPTTVAICNGTVGQRMWYTSNVTVVLVAFDNNYSSLDTRYSLDSGSWSEYSSKILVTGDGIHTLQYRSEDGQGNLEETKTALIRVDGHAPSLSSQLLKEYRFRTDISDTRYIHASFVDGTSGIDYSFTEYNRTRYGYDYPAVTYSASDWHSIIPETGTQFGAIEVLDGAGNSFTQTIKIRASVSPNTTPLSHEGPYGWWLILAVVVDMAVGLATLGVLASSRENGLPGGKWTPRPEGERHYDEDVIDGYGKFKRQV